MFKSIINLFKKNKSSADILDIPTMETITLEDVTYENEVVKSNEEKAKVKDTKETKSTLTFGK
jgi:hypothetical protein|tara:strand:+ start:123 stop:311 length:189 start_codon:yes stop_codon:yes gene_type:complete